MDWLAMLKGILKPREYFAKVCPVCHTDMKEITPSGFNPIGTKTYKCTNDFCQFEYSPPITPTKDKLPNKGDTRGEI